MNRWLLVASATVAVLLLGAQCQTSHVPQPLPPVATGGSAPNDAGMPTGGDTNQDASTGGQLVRCSCAPASKVKAAPRKRSTRIVLGTQSENDYSWMISFQDPTGWHYCGGTLVAPDVALTAAHCKPATGDKLRIGSRDRTKGGEVRAVETSCENPLYEEHRSWDATLVKLSGPSTLKPIPLATTIGQKAITIGWGVTSETGQTSPVIHREVWLPIVKPVLCFDVAPTICAGYEQSGEDSCYGDSGGPLAQMGANGLEQIGIVSRGNGCGRIGEYGRYTQIPDGVRDWIESCVQDETSW